MAEDKNGAKSTVLLEDPGEVPCEFWLGGGLHKGDDFIWE
jgi:hypothetical protein